MSRGSRCSWTASRVAATPRWKKQPAPSPRIHVLMTVASAEEASRTLVAAWLLTKNSEESLPEGPEREGSRQARARLLRLSYWFGMLVDKAPLKKVPHEQEK